MEKYLPLHPNIVLLLEIAKNRKVFEKQNKSLKNKHAHTHSGRCSGKNQAMIDHKILRQNTL